MGDRCWLSMTFKTSDLPVFEEVLGKGFWNERDENGDGVTVHVCEANYGWYEERLKLAKRGITFWGSHGEGDEYGAATFVAHAGEYEEVEAIHDGSPVVRVEAPGIATKADMNGVRNYFALLLKAEAASGQRSLEAGHAAVETG